MSNEDDDDLFGYFEEYDYDDEDEDDSSPEEPEASAEDDSPAADDSDGGDSATEDSDEPEEAVAEAEPEPEPEPEPDPDPDSPEAIEALLRHKVRIDYNDKGMAWRVFLYERCGDPVLALLGGLPSLKEVWVIGSKCTKKGVLAFKEHAPKVTVY